MPLRLRFARFNRVFANQLAGPVFTHLPGFGKVHHRGRRTGTAYATPVKLFRHGTDYVITLPYGPGTDWVKNVLAASGCEISARGVRARVQEPRVVSLGGLAAVPPAVRRALSWLGCTEALVLTPVPSVPHRFAAAEGASSDVSTA